MTFQCETHIQATQDMTSDCQTKSAVMKRKKTGQVVATTSYNMIYIVGGLREYKKFQKQSLSLFLEHFFVKVKFMDHILNFCESNSRNNECE